MKGSKAPPGTEGRDRRGRLQTNEIIRAAAHPTRQLILKLLKDKELSTIELEVGTGENRYNLYHHLGVLTEAGLIEAELQDSRPKRYRLTRAGDPRETFFQLERAEVTNPGALDRVLESISAALGEPVSDPHEVQSLTIMLRYSDR
jgi:DNA-binding transcriptional ArsR family regulator